MHSIKLGVVSLLALAAATACTASSDDSGDFTAPSTSLDPNAREPGPRGAPEEPPMLGAHAAKGAARPGGGGNPNMTGHGGAIMTSAFIQPIYWGVKWGTDGTNAYAADKVAGLQTFYGGLNGSTYANTNTEYDGTNGHVGVAVDVGAPVFDNSAAPARAPKTSAILAEVCKKIGNPQPNGYYPVYTDTKRGGAGYCAWHSYGTCGTTPVQFGFFFDLDGDGPCTPDAAAVDGHGQGLTALANVSGHEYSEAVTDPRNGGWWDASGNENSDKCAWVFPEPVTLTNGSHWVVQGNWSNAAYTAGTGYANRDNQKGCLQTKAF